MSKIKVSRGFALSDGSRGESTLPAFSFWYLLQLMLFPGLIDPSLQSLPLSVITWTRLLPMHRHIIFPLCVCLVQTSPFN